LQKEGFAMLVKSVDMTKLDANALEIWAGIINDSPDILFVIFIYFVILAVVILALFSKKKRHALGDADMPCQDFIITESSAGAGRKVWLLVFAAVLLYLGFFVFKAAVVIYGHTAVNVSQEPSELSGQTQQARQGDAVFNTIAERARQGDVEAQAELGFMYFEGKRGIAQDQAQAFFWLKEAAKHGHVRAQTLVGYMYYRGRGVDKDYKQFFYWSMKAARQGDADAMYNVGRSYHRGDFVVSQDLDQALFWYEKAAALGHDVAARRIVEIKESQM